MSPLAIERQRTLSLTRSGIFLACVGLAFVHPVWGLYGLFLIYVFQVVQSRRMRRKRSAGP